MTTIRYSEPITLDDQQADNPEDRVRVERLWRPVSWRPVFWGAILEFTVVRSRERAGHDRRGVAIDRGSSTLGNCAS